MTPPLAYLDFDLTIERGAGRDYPLRLDSPAGQARETFRLPFDSLQLKNALLQLQNALLRSGGRRRKVLSAGQQAVQDFGGKLFDALICGEVRSCFDVSRLKAESEGQGLRLRLRIDPPELIALPWEYLYDCRRDAYLVLSRHTPVVRYLELPRPAGPLAVPLPLRLLAVIANPTDTLPLDADRERERIETALRSLVSTGCVDIHWLSPPTWRELQRVLRPAPGRSPYHILHFVGHGEFDRLREEGELILENEQHRADRLPAGKLARLLADHLSLRLAVLNACESAYLEGNDPFASAAATLVHAGLPAVVAMQFEITDDAAVEFSRTFYESLADNLPVDAALAEARKAIDLAAPNSVEWGTPVLYTHAPNGQIFDLTAAPPVGAGVVPASPVQVVTPPPPPKPKELPRVLTLEKAGIELILIPAGEFLMGSPKGEGSGDEHPQHPLDLPDYYLARTPTTNAQFARFIQDGGYRRREFWTEAGWRVKEKQGWTQPRFWGNEKWNGPHLPVVGVSWYEALAFAGWAGGTLPSEAEWEKAASWDPLAGRKRRYPWSDEWDAKRCNTGEEGPGQTTPVGRYSPAGDSFYGLADMAGNVWEWCRSRWVDYPYDPDDGREDVEGSALRVLRGGSWGSDRSYARCAARDGYYPLNSSSGIGFRVASPVCSDF
ncbi:MAG: SUMF1/EgtB/PvdO family nonheme iron enzyme [Chloroflexota bacterium]